MKNIFKDINKNLNSDFSPDDILDLGLTKDWEVSKNFTETDIKIEKIIYKGTIQNELKDFLKSIMKKKRVSPDFIRYHIEDIDWKIVSEYQKLDINFMEEYKDRLCWDILGQRDWITENILRKFHPFISFKRLCDLVFPLSDQFIKDYMSELNWIQILSNQQVNTEILDILLSSGNPIIGWILKTQKLGDDFIKKYKNLITRYSCWKRVSQCQNLSEKFIEELDSEGLIYWRELGYAQTLSEKFIDKHQDDLNWEKISKYQEMSEEFMNNHIGYLIMNKLNKNKKICSQSLEKFKKYWELK